jgi:hypothetical protein
LRSHNANVPTHIELADYPSSPPEISNYRADALGWCTDVGSHDWFKQGRSRPPDCFSYGHRAGDAEVHRSRINLMHRPAEQRHTQVSDGIPGDDALVKGLPHSLLGWTHVLGHYLGLRGLVDELDARTALARLDLQAHAREVSVSACLLFVHPSRVRGPTDRLAVRNLGLADGRPDAKLPCQSVNRYLQVELTHS